MSIEQRLQQMEARLNRLEGRAELPSRDYEVDPFMDIAGPHLTLFFDGRILLSLPDTPTNRRILTGMAWAHWHTSEVGK